MPRLRVFAILAAVLLGSLLFLAACGGGDDDDGPMPTLAPIGPADEARLRAIAAEFLDAASEGDKGRMKDALAERLRGDDEKLDAFIDCLPEGHRFRVMATEYSLDIGSSVVEIRIGLEDESGAIVRNGTDLWGFERQPDSTWLLGTVPVCLFTDDE